MCEFYNTKHTKKYNDDISSFVSLNNKLNIYLPKRKNEEFLSSQNPKNLNINWRLVRPKRGSQIERESTSRLLISSSQIIIKIKI